MAAFKQQLGQDNVLPIPLSQRKLGFFGIFSIWLAANFVITTILTGMMFIPDITFAEAVRVIFIGSALGAIPLALVGMMGTKTGLPTMVIARGAFGNRGALLPAIANTVVLIGWSWIQAYMAGLSLNFAMNHIFGIDNIVLFVILAQTIVVTITIFGIRGVEKTQRLVATALLLLSLSVFYVLFTTYDVHSLVTLAVSENPEISAIIAFDIVITTAFSWMSSVCDYNRNAKSVKNAAIATYSGHIIASCIAMGMGAAVGGFSLVQGIEQTYDPTVLLSAHGFGLVAALVIFISTISTNVMALYSANMSLLNVFPRLTFWKPALVMGVVTIMGALLREVLMENFFDFVLFVATLFIPIFSIMITDFYFVKKRVYDAEDIATNEKKKYWYQSGFNVRAFIAYAIAAAFCIIFTYILPLAIGATILTFIIAGVFYYLLMTLGASQRISKQQALDN